MQIGALESIAGRRKNEITKFTVNTARPKVGDKPARTLQRMLDFKR